MGTGDEWVLARVSAGGRPEMIVPAGSQFRNPQVPSQAVSASFNGGNFHHQPTAGGSDPLSTPELMGGVHLAQGTQKAQQELSLGESVSQANLTITEHASSSASPFSDPTDGPS